MAYYRMLNRDFYSVEKNITLSFLQKIYKLLDIDIPYIWV